MRREVTKGSRKKKTTTPTETYDSSLEVEGVKELERSGAGPIESEKIELEGPHGFVEVGLGLTLRLARQYEMARVDVRVNFPCQPDNAEKSYTKARAFCVERIRSEMDAIRSHANREVPTKRRD